MSIDHYELATVKRIIQGDKVEVGPAVGDTDEYQWEPRYISVGADDMGELIQKGIAEAWEQQPGGEAIVWRFMPTIDQILGSEHRYTLMARYSVGVRK